MLIEQYIQELTHWNSAHNLISKNEINNISEHLEDSLSLYDIVQNYSSIIDIGSGGGFPIVPLACMSKENKNDRHFIATDIIEKKLAFLKWCAAKLELNIDVIKVEKKTLFTKKSLIISRAFSSIKNIILWRDQHAPHCTEFALLKGQSVEQELSEANIDQFTLIKNPRGFIVQFTNVSQYK